MSPERNDESGRYTPTYPLEDFLEVIDAEGGMAGTQDVSDRLGCSYELAYKRLKQLEDDGKIASRKVGNARLWIAESTGSADADNAPNVSGADGPQDVPEVRRDPTPADAPPTDETANSRARAVVDAVAAAEVNPDSERTGWDDDYRLADRKAAAIAVLTHVLTTGDAVGKSDAIDEFHDEYPVDGQSAETWWVQNIRPVLKAIGSYSNAAHGYVIDEERVDEITREESDGE